MEQLLAEELLLLVLDEESGCPQTSFLDAGLAAALLVDLGCQEALRSAANSCTMHRAIMAVPAATRAATDQHCRGRRAGRAGHVARAAR